MPRGAIERPPLVIVANTIIFIYSTVVITLLGTHVAPASGLDCGLRQRWQNLFRIKDSKSIKAIQDAFSCCGYSNPRDMAWPFQDKTHPATACQEAFGRNTGMIVLWAVCIWLVVSRAFTDYDASLQSLLSPLRAIRGFTKSFPSVSPA
jgi:predicted membrane protein